jgi:RHS repeat-associated protein
MNQKQENSHPIKISEQMIYGSSRIGLNDKFSQLISWTPPPFDRPSRTMGLKSYELTDHLGNVLTTISDRRKHLAGPTPAFEAVMETAQDYYPFGSLIPGRKYNAGEYRFGFNGKEKDDEVTGVTGATYDYGFRIYDSRIARFLSVDPLAMSFPFYTPYQFSANMPIAAVDLDGLEAVIKINSAWYQNEIDKTVNDGDVQRAIYLASKSIGDPAKNEYAKKAYGSDYAGTFNYSEQNPEGLTVYNSNGDMIFNLKQMSPQKQQQGKVAEESSGSWYDPILEFLGMLDATSGSGEKIAHEGGGIMFTSSTGQGLETRVAVDKSKVDGPINLDDLLGVFGATKAASGGPAKNVIEGVAKIIDAANIGKNINDKLDNSNLFKCKACAAAGRDSIYKNEGGKNVPAKGSTTNEKKTHY